MTRVIRQLPFSLTKLLLLLTAFFFSTFNLSAQEPNPPKKISIEELQKDLTFLKKALEDIHPGMYYFTDKETYNQLYDSIYQSLQTPLSRVDFREKIAPLILQLQCGHTRLLASHKDDKKKPKKYFPLQLRQIEGKVLVNKNYGEDTSMIFKGVEILAINGMPIDSILQLFYRNTTRGSDGDNETGKQFYNLRFFTSRFAEWFGRPDSFQIEYLTPKTTDYQTISIAALTSKVMAQNYKTHFGKPPQNISLEWLNDETAVLKIRSFVDLDSDYGLNFWGQVRAYFREIKQLEAEHLIIDVRGNGGGALKNSFKLMQYLETEPFSVNKALLAKAKAVSNVGFREKLMLGFSFKRTDSTYISSKSFTQIRQPKQKLGYKRKVYLLIDGGSYSASALFAAHLHSKNRATIVGEESGGNYYLAFAGFWTVKTLPHSKISVRIPLIRLEYDVESDVPFNKGVPPNIGVTQTYSDFLEGKDTQLEAVLDLIESEK
ncbi:MAG: S41 family peptidase [Chitinophagales bacterium]